MAEWFEVYENPAALAAARQQLRQSAVGVALASGAIVAAAPVAALVWPAWSMWVAGVALALLVGHAGAFGWQARRQRRTVWRLDLSVRHVVGHDVTGARRVLAWSDVTWVDVGDSLEIVGRRMGRRVRVVLPASFPDHAHVGHRVVRYAEAFGRPVFVDGRPSETLNIDPLRQILAGASAPRRKA